MKHILAATGAALAMTALTPATQAATEFNFSNWLPWTHKLTTGLYVPWMKDIEEKTGGRVTFRKLPKPVAHPRAHLDAVRTGQADAGFGVHGYSPKRLRAYLFSEFSLLGESAVATSVAFHRTYEKFFKDKGHYKGVHMIGLYTHGPGVIHHSSRVIQSIADMKGQKIRTGGPVPRAIIENWGGISIRQPAPKSYELLSTGVVDGVTFPYESLIGFKIANLVKFHTELPGGLYCSGFYTMIVHRTQEEIRQPVGGRPENRRRSFGRGLRPARRQGVGPERRRGAGGGQEGRPHLRQGDARDGGVGEGAEGQARSELCRRHEEGGHRRRGRA